MVDVKMAHYTLVGFKLFSTKVMLEIIQILLHSFYKLICHRSQKKRKKKRGKSYIHLLYFEIYQLYSLLC